jgi:uncharacterized Zn finger protein
MLEPMGTKMVNAKIHIICGNCGSNDQFKLDLVENNNDDGFKIKIEPILICENCSTIHYITESIPIRKD